MLLHHPHVNNPMCITEQQMIGIKSNLFDVS